MLDELLDPHIEIQRMLASPDYNAETRLRILSRYYGTDPESKPGKTVWNLLDEDPWLSQD